MLGLRVCTTAAQLRENVFLLPGFFVCVLCDLYIFGQLEASLCRTLLWNLILRTVGGAVFQLQMFEHGTITVLTEKRHRWVRMKARSREPGSAAPGKLTKGSLIS